MKLKESKYGITVYDSFVLISHESKCYAVTLGLNVLFSQNFASWTTKSVRKEVNIFMKNKLR